jgi:hypothetical protein
LYFEKQILYHTIEMSFFQQGVIACDLTFNSLLLRDMLHFNPNSKNRISAPLAPSHLCHSVDVVPILDRYRFGHVIDLVHSDKSRSKFKHVVSQGDDDKLSVLRPLLDVTRNNRNLLCQWVSQQKVGHVLTFLKSNAASISSIT